MTTNSSRRPESKREEGRGRWLQRLPEEEGHRNGKSLHHGANAERGEWEREDTDKDTGQEKDLGRYEKQGGVKRLLCQSSCTLVSHHIYHPAWTCRWIWVSRGQAWAGGVTALLCIATVREQRKMPTVGRWAFNPLAHGPQ